jgi:hypothetical protein
VMFVKILVNLHLTEEKTFGKAWMTELLKFYTFMVQSQYWDAKTRLGSIEVVVCVLFSPTVPCWLNDSSTVSLTQ